MRSGWPAPPCAACATPPALPGSGPNHRPATCHRRDRYTAPAPAAVGSTTGARRDSSACLSQTRRRIIPNSAPDVLRVQPVPLPPVAALDGDDGSARVQVLLARDPHAHRRLHCGDCVGVPPLPRLRPRKHPPRTCLCQSQGTSVSLRLSPEGPNLLHRKQISLRSQGPCSKALPEEMYSQGG